MDYVILASIIVTVMFGLIAIFQVLLSLGFPLGEFALGGYNKVLPAKLRIVSAVNAIIVLCMGIIFLQHTDVFNRFSFLPTHLLVWIITIFLGLNTIANLVSQNKKEKYVMTPLSSITFVLCLFIALS